MSTAMQDAFANQRQPQRGNRQPAAPPPAARSISQILADAKARAEARRQRAKQSADTNIVQTVVALRETQTFLETDYAELDRNRSLYPDATRQLGEIKRELDQIKVDIDAHLNPKQEDGEDEATFEGRRHMLLLSVEQANRLVDLRSAARTWTDAIKATASPDAKTISAFLEDAEGNIGPFVADVEAKSPNRVTGWGKRQNIGSIAPDDDVVTEVVKAFGEMVDRFTAKKETEADDVVQLLNHAGYYLSDDEVTELRKSPDSTNLTMFLGEGKARFSVVNGRHNECLVIERRNGRTYPYKASGAHIGRMAFLYRDHKAGGAFKPVDPSRLRSLDHNGTDVSKVWHDQIREMMEFQLQREADRAEKREASREIKSVADLKDPITTYDLTFGKVGTCVLSYSFYDEAKRRWSEVPAYRLSSDGTVVWVSGFVPGALEKADPNKTWLRREVRKGEPSLLDAQNPLPLADLRKTREWKEASRANGSFEAEWQTELKTKELGATAVSRANHGNLLGIENRVDGVYTFTTTVRRKSQAQEVFWVTGGFAWEVVGSTIKPIWATPNVRREAGKLGSEPVEVANMPNPFRDIGRSLYMAVNNLRGKDAWKQAPDHLQRVFEERPDNGNGEAAQETATE